MRRIAFHNLGCKVNSYETDYLEQKSIEKGYEIVKFEQKADVYVVNTCSVTNIADRKSRQMLHKAKKTNPDSIVVAVGCFVQANAEEAQKDESIDILIGNNKKTELFEILDEYIKNSSASDNSDTVESKDNCSNGDTNQSEKIEQSKNKEDISNILSRSKTLGGKTLTDVKNCEFEEMGVSKSVEHSRVFVKIQDGCDRYCTYCIIPYVRGNIRSRKPEDVIKEIKTVAANGYKEVVVTGIHLSSYGKDFIQKTNPTQKRFEYDDSAEYLIKVLKDINDIEGIERIRIGSFEPMILTEDFVEKLSKIDKLCPHFHISLQSGSDSVLKRMNRHYNTEEFYEKTVLLRKHFPGCALTTDVIAGFPGETQEEFEETYKYLEKIEFFETHIFPYSRRKGTVADKMSGQLSMNEKKARGEKLIALDDKLSLRFRESKLGGMSNIIVEETKTINGKEYLVGHTPEYVFCAIEHKKENINLIGQKRRVSLKSMLDDKTVLAVFT